MAAQRQSVLRASTRPQQRVTTAILLLLLALLLFLHGRHAVLLQNAFATSHPEEHLRESVAVNETAETAKFPSFALPWRPMSSMPKRASKVHVFTVSAFWVA